jgi:hypothetical protein
LYHILAERAKEIAGKRKLETKSFIIELRVDGTLEKGNLHVQHSWEDTSTAGKTGVLARPKSGKLAPPAQALPEVSRPPAKPTNPNYPRQSMEAAYIPPPASPNFTEGKPPTGNISQAKPVDIALSGDPEISRRHISIGTDGLGNFWAINEGRNPAMIGNYELPAGQRVRLNPGVNIQPKS